MPLASPAQTMVEAEHDFRDDMGCSMVETYRDRARVALDRVGAGVDRGLQQSSGNRAAWRPGAWSTGLKRLPAFELVNELVNAGGR